MEHSPQPSQSTSADSVQRWQHGRGAPPPSQSTSAGSGESVEHPQPSQSTSSGSMRQRQWGRGAPPSPPKAPPWVAVLTRGSQVPALLVGAPPPLLASPRGKTKGSGRWRRIWLPPISSAVTTVPPPASFHFAPGEAGGGDRAPLLPFAALQTPHGKESWGSVMWRLSQPAKPKDGGGSS
ncbi:neural Wiskott-Aldrich syndrome protein-like [Notechis scutatus]|uniref:Neural Wiskott-Aldrich syndrome protein-like n=1 Tax=Notechis scutatus TaxID=8663 RepID=A0A6J1TTY1_9SAUR|nr:neural Wiskott-Aldrich syndrome protein-like [Notechis scutatus]